MGCNCGSKEQKWEYVYTDAKGKQTTYRTEYEAKAARARNQGQGSVRSVVKS